MPIVPENFRTGALFQVLDPVNKIAKFDGVVAAAVTTRIQDGTWVVWGPNGVIKAGAVAAPDLGIKAAFPTMSDHDPDDVVGHPDSGRLGQVTLLVGQHRGRTAYWQRAGIAGHVCAGALGGEVSALPVVGDPLGVVQAGAATVAAINLVQANAVLASDGVLYTSANLVVNEAVAICLTTPAAANNNMLEYILL